MGCINTETSPIWRGQRGISCWHPAEVDAPSWTIIWSVSRTGKESGSHCLADLAHPISTEIRNFCSPIEKGSVNNGNFGRRLQFNAARFFVCHCESNSVTRQLMS